MGLAKSGTKRQIEQLPTDPSSEFLCTAFADRQEVESLCSSIALRQKYSKSVARLQGSLAEIEEERRGNLEGKIKEREELQAAAEEIRQVFKYWVEVWRVSVHNLREGSRYRFVQPITYRGHVLVLYRDCGDHGGD